MAHFSRQDKDDLASGGCVPVSTATTKRDRGLAGGVHRKHPGKFFAGAQNAEEAFGEHEIPVSRAAQEGKMLNRWASNLVDVSVAVSAPQMHTLLGSLA